MRHNVVLVNFNNLEKGVCSQSLQNKDLYNSYNFRSGQKNMSFVIPK
jgi:hypothetical protein